MKTRRRERADVSISRSNDEAAAIRQGLALLKAEELITTRDVVVITPNWVQQQAPQTGVVVGTESLRQVIRFCKAQNPRRVVVATGSGEKDTSEIMKNVGYDRIIREEEVEFIDLNKGPFTRVALTHDHPVETQLNHIYEEMTFLVSFSQLKYHQEATVTAAIKNIMLGWPPAEEHGFPKMGKGIHIDLHGFIRALAEKLPIDLSIVSADPAMIGTGPAGGIPVHTGMVLCSTDPVAVDTIGARLLGFQPQAISYLYQCIRKGIGVGDLQQMNMQGLSLKEAEGIFSRTAYGEEVVIDKG